MRRPLLVLALVWLLGACAGGQPAARPTVAPTAAPAEEPPAETPWTDATPGADDAAPAPTTPEEDGGTAPWAGTVATVDGGDLAGADFVRQDVALWFWAPW